MGLRLILAWLLGVVLVGMGAVIARADGGLGEAPPKPGASSGGGTGGLGGKPTPPEAPTAAEAPPYRPPVAGYRPQTPTVSTPGDGYDLRRQRNEPVIIVKTPPSAPSQPWYGWKSMPPFNHVGGSSSSSSSYKKW